VARVDFHSQVSDKLTYTCRLARKICSISEGKDPIKNIVIVGPLQTLKGLDQLLWTFSPDEFLPHCFLDDEAAAYTPIVFSDHFDPQAFSQIPHQDVFIHLGQEFLNDIEKITERFDRVVEVVSTEEHDLLAGRERYKQYRTMGLELFNHDQKGAS
jgi:DNA polymerase-3 subunit chi